jgi:glycosyltransferase involved in cell wall biosynthesis
MKRIAIVIPTLDRIGGAEQQAILLAEGLSQRGWRVTVIALSGTGGTAEIRLRDADIQFIPLGMRKGLADPRGWIRLNRWLLQVKPDVVHAHLPHAAWIARWSRLGAPVRVLADTIHSTATGTSGRKLGYNASNWLVDRVTAVSHAAAEAWSVERMVSAEKLVVVANGVDTSVWKPDAAARASLRAELKLNEDFLWLAAGRLEPVKDYQTLLHAMAQLPANTQLVIAGRGPLEAELKQRSQSLGIEDRVRFLGFEPDLRRWMQAADGFVLSSRWEGLPMGVLEAAACGLPAVATNIPGTREAIVDGETGLLTTATGSSTALEGAMKRLMQMTPEDRAAMGERARKHILERYSIEAVLDRWEALYAEMLATNPKPKRWG